MHGGEHTFSRIITEPCVNALKDLWSEVNVQVVHSLRYGLQGMQAHRLVRRD